MSAEFPRRARRTLVNLSAQCRTVSGRDRGQISDISPQGCCVRSAGSSFRVGSHVVIRPDGLDALGGTVRWVARDCAGVEFDHVIFPPVVGHLVQMHRAGAQVTLIRD